MLCDNDLPIEKSTPRMRIVSSLGTVLTQTLISLEEELEKKRSNFSETKGLGCLPSRRYLLVVGTSADVRTRWWDGG